MPFLDCFDLWDGSLPVALVVPTPNRGERRGQLRAMAARAAGLASDQVHIVHEEGRPPRIERPAATSLHLSSASRAGISALAVASGPIGIDIELVEPDQDPPWNVLHPDEAEAILRLDPAARASAFAQLWACKEAYLKALGLGLSRDPASFRVALGPEGQASIGDPERAGLIVDIQTGWREQDGRLFALALATCGSPRAIGEQTS